MRGLDVIEAVADQSLTATELAEKLGLTKSTAHRLASALVDRGFLANTPRSGYRLGPRMLALGHRASEQADIIQLARPHLESLGALTEDTVHLGVLDADRASALYLDKIPGRRRINISSRVGERHPLTCTGLGKALILDESESWLAQRFTLDQAAGARPPMPRCGSSACATMPGAAMPSTLRKTRTASAAFRRRCTMPRARSSRRSACRARRNIWMTSAWPA
jgi:DNA-binding IclR family transcriptional regulator